MRQKRATPVTGFQAVLKHNEASWLAEHSTGHHGAQDDAGSPGSSAA